MALPPHVWSQVKSLSADTLRRALERDGWTLEAKSGATLSYIKSIPTGGRARVVVHYHPGKTWGPKFLQGLLRDIGWDHDDLRRLKLIK